MVRQTASVLYWDGSAVMAALLPEPHHDDAQLWADRPGTHIISTLTWAEVLAAISRVEREGKIASTAASAAREEFGRPPWSHLQESPDWIIVRDLASKWPLTGPDLWHLALAKTLQHERPELRLLSFDERLSKAAAGEGLAAFKARL